MLSPTGDQRILGIVTWISEYDQAKNGREAFEALRKHYGGPGQIEKRLGYARKIVANTTNQSEKLYIALKAMYPSYLKPFRYNEG
jgi:hypothetical protein